MRGAGGGGDGSVGREPELPLPPLGPPAAVQPNTSRVFAVISSGSSRAAIATRSAHKSPHHVRNDSARSPSSVFQRSAKFSSTTVGLAR